MHLKKNPEAIHTWIDYLRCIFNEEKCKEKLKKMGVTDDAIKRAKVKEHDELLKEVNAEATRVMKDCEYNFVKSQVLFGYIEQMEKKRKVQA
jgi:hypothetical protein